MNARGVGAAVGAAIVATYLYGPSVATAILIWASQNPDKIEQIGQTVMEAAGGPPGLTLAPNSALRATEIDGLERLAKQMGSRLLESPHVGEEVIVAGTEKTIDIMGSSVGYSSSGFSLRSFFNSIDHHVTKSADYIAIDLKGASKEQILAIKDHVRKLEKALRDKIIYISP